MVSADLAVLTILGVAALRGVFLGLIRELFSVAGLVAACLAVRFLNAQATQALLDIRGLEVPEFVVRTGCGIAIAVVTLLLVHLLGRLVRRGVQAVGLGWADRAAGGMLGVTEGLLVAGIVLALAVLALGKEHRLVANSYSLATLETMQGIATQEQPTLPSVAAPSIFSK